ncbi:30S ribosomal protein S6, partial [Patescibacteria group bacterium]|nr:30S ribosomal protein S6 [Patescibacteria group bacterium]
IYHEELLGIRNFSYRIKKQSQGYYLVLNFEMDSSRVKELEKQMNIMRDLLRYLIIKIPSDYEIKSLTEFDKELEAVYAERKKKREEKQQSTVRKPAPRAKVVKVEKKEEVTKPAKTVAPVEKPSEKVEEKPMEEPTKAQKQASLDDVDEKLKSIIDDPDISL